MLLLRINIHRDTKGEPWEYILAAALCFGIWLAIRIWQKKRRAKRNGENTPK